ncbi:hypothetical protein L208DRAFT_1410378 [Tricholoma matsutake]|nr:hypothetical protein L208DRAFT_1410378 [Tricholoma matsutake 945]
MTENSPDEETNNNEPWTLVESKRARRRRHSDTETTEFLRGNRLTSEQETAVKNAEQNLTAEERERIDCRYEKVHFDSDGDESSRGEGPSKGKGVDPSNWGALKFESSELDVDTQREAMKAWNMVRDQDQNKESKTSKGKSPHQKNSKHKAKGSRSATPLHKARIKIVMDEDAPKASAPAAAKENPSETKFTLMSDALMN